MALAIAEARRGEGLTSPNPPVGAVVVDGDRVIGRGFHRKAGGPHAEVVALADAKATDPEAIRGATLYVTLEPCTTHGRTPPCTDAIREAGLGRVVYGAEDVNPSHRGEAARVLRRAGIEVTTGVRGEECIELIRPFAKWITSGLPYVIAKAGQSLDGRITRPAGESSWITSEAARAAGRQLRHRCDAILVGAETVRTDDPSLVLRPDEAPAGKPQPWRVILTRSGKLPSHAQVFTDEHRDRTLVMQPESLVAALRVLAKREVVSVLIEGGGQVFGQAFRDQLVDEVHWFIAPRLCGGGRPSIEPEHDLARSIALTNVQVRPLGDNVHVSGIPEYSTA